MNFTFIALLIVIAFPTSSFAMGELRFNSALPLLQESEIDSFLRKEFETKSTDYIIAQTDLNNDLAKEYVLKRNYCKTKNEQSCNHIIIGKTKDKFVVLGNIRAKKLVISSTKTHNITDILAFDNDLNDYDFDIYVWSPKEKMYILEAN